ncbi:MAG: hypothetical protein WBM32_18510 [Crocosphaera sp.]|jgi:hypothetical protein
MTHPKPSQSSLRYFIAGLKPLGNFKVWCSLGVIGIVTLTLWQYYRHPEFLGEGDVPSTNTRQLDGGVVNSNDLGVQPADFQDIPPNQPRFPTPSPKQPLNNPLRTTEAGNPILNDRLSNPLLPSSSAPKNSSTKQEKPSVGFKPLIPSFNDLGSLFPPLTPSKNASQPIKIPDSKPLNTARPTETPLSNALEDVFSQDSSPVDKWNVSPQNGNQSIPPTRRPGQPSYPTPSTTRSNYNPNINQPYQQPYNNPYARPYNNSVPNNSPQSYQQPYNNQPYTNPYGNGTAPAPRPAYPPSSQFPNPNANVNPNYSNQPNQTRPQNNYGVQPPQVNRYEGVGY